MQDEFLRLQNLLHKTIIFITHDFDEAIRLADRIAIMYEGRIVQLGTAEELVTNPATDHVRAFTRDIPKAKLLTVRSIMGPTDAVHGDGAEIGGDQLIGDVAGLVIGQDKPVSVVDPSGKLVGSLTRGQVVDVLFSDDA